MYHRGSLREKEGGRRKVRVRVINIRRIRPDNSAFENGGRGPRVEERVQYTEAGKDKETDPPLGLPGVAQSCLHLDLSSVKPILDF